MAYGDFSRRIHTRAANERCVTNAQLELTYRCNLHCRHCYTDPYNSKDWISRELTVPEIVQLIDDMAEIGIIWLNLTGGEIFQHPHFWDIYGHAFRRGFLLQLYSNGTLFTNAVVERLKEVPPFTIDISCHSVEEASFDWFTKVPGSFRAFRRGLELLQQARLPFTLKTKAMNWNKHEMPAIKRFVESFGQQFSVTTSLSPRLDGDLTSLAYRLEPNDVVALQKDLLGGFTLAERCEHPTDMLQQPTDQLYRCGCGTNTIHINARGELGTCTLQYERRISLRTYSLSDAIERLFEQISSMRYRGTSPCKTCTLHTFCEKKPTDARWEYADAEAPIPYDCDVALARAEAATKQVLIHPLRKTQSCESPV